MNTNDPMNKPTDTNSNNAMNTPVHNSTNSGMNHHMHDKSFFTTNVLGALVVGLILGFILGAYYVKNSHNVANNDIPLMNDGEMINTNGTSTDNSTASTTTTVTSVNNGASVNSDFGNVDVTVKDMRAGNNVMVENLHLDQGYWVAVRDSEQDNKAPFVLGAIRLAKGTYNNVSIPLSRNTVQGKRYDIVVYKDKGGVFENSFASLVTSQGAASHGTFTAQ